MNVSEAWETFKQAMRDDSEYAWAWQCNLAMPIMDAIGCSQAKANEAAANLLGHLFECDVTNHPHYRWEKSGAQRYAEVRRAADRNSTLA